MRVRYATRSRCARIGKGGTPRPENPAVGRLGLHVDRQRRAAGHRRGPATRELNEDALVRRMSRTIDALTSTRLELYVAIVKLKVDNWISAKKLFVRSLEMTVITLAYLGRLSAVCG